MYWPAFEFSFRLDIPRLLPHIAAIEASQEAALSRVLPPQWREAPVAESSRQLDPPAEPLTLDEIRVRKEQVQSHNASRAQAWVRQRFVPGSERMSLNDILDMHRLSALESGVRYGDAGTLRHSGLAVTVGRAEVGGIHFGAPETRLQPLMEEYVQFVNSGDVAGLPAIMHALVAHFFFTTLHPFDDGNGRVSRLVSAGILFQRGYNGHGFYALSNYFYHHDMKYHTLLHQAWQRSLPFDLTAFFAFGMEGLAFELQGINSFIRVKLHRSGHDHSCR
jgi:Fic family protein